MNNKIQKIYKQINTDKKKQIPYKKKKHIDNPI